jgi:UDP-N-acetylglucosamine--N-acetylmuramyl-(pentapeptide) pyrophosphoryl-undecaprenol N-acetylglucosamine transferase
MGLPLVLLEQNVVPGRATTWLSRFASCVCLSFAETTGPVRRRHNSVVTGNPVRRKVAALCSEEKSAPRGSRATLLILGGSQGARAINDAMLAAAKSLQPSLGNWQVVHQTGQSDVDQVREIYAQHGIEAVVEAFFDDLVPWYRAATLVLSRAGATTLAELACAGCPSLLVPYPNSLGDHQRANARWFEARGAADIVEEGERTETTAARLVEKLLSLAADTLRRDAMERAMRTAARPDAARDVAECVRRQFC